MKRMAEMTAIPDLSVATPANPYDTLIESCKGDPMLIQHFYQAHRQSRNEQQIASILDPGFPGWRIDPILQKLVDPKQYPGYVDPRNCLVFWARPPQNICKLIGVLQDRLLKMSPNLWFMPLNCLHMTVLEVTHSQTSAEIEMLVRRMAPKISQITEYTIKHRARLVMPQLSYDNQAIALSLLPACDEVLPGMSRNQADIYTYHHLRRDLYDLCSATGVSVASRYTVPSAHLTIARFVTQDGVSRDENGYHLNPTYMKKWILLLNEINTWLEVNYWPRPNSSTCQEGEWIVGSEKGLECRKGTVWYGGGDSVRLGQGFVI